MDLGRDKTVCKIISRLEQNEKPAVKAEGTWGSFAPLLVNYISEKTARPILYIRPHIDDADKTSDDLLAFGAKNIETLPAWEAEEDLADATDEIRSERAKLVSRVSSLATRGSQLIIAASVQAVCQPVPKPEALKTDSLSLRKAKDCPPEKIIKWLIENGFERVDKIDMPGQFAQRGGIVDIYAPLVSVKKKSSENNDDFSQAGTEAVRIEFFGDTIESIRRINLDTQRSVQPIERIDIISALCGTSQKQSELFTNILPKDCIVILEEPNDIEEVANVFLERVENPRRLYKWRDIYRSIGKFAQLHIYRFAGSEQENFLRLGIKSVQQFQCGTTAVWAGHKEALEELLRQSKQDKKVRLYCEASAEIKRLTEIIEQSNQKVPRNFQLIRGFINQGFVIDSLDTIVISHHELFGQFAIRRRQRPIRPSAPVETLEDLRKGDYVVHASYGIGKFLGITAIKQKAGTSEYLTIEYANGVKIQVSTSNINLVQKYIGTSPKRPALGKVGSKKWLRQKEKVANAVQDLAVMLLDIQAQRRTAGGIAYEPDSNWQNEFEESFPYQETADQTNAAEQIKMDMQQAVAMDRLLCGDVGYGKTELAMRAAFKTVENGKQVAVLVPTTVLSVQHGRTFTERFADFPVSIEVLNRFRSTAEAKDVISKAKKGRADIVIGTHRLLSRDIGFKDLGLLVIDEEQRFGVEHKERLKRLRVNVDVLTMTATPIPRTLHMSLLGLRDISSLGTPPLDRRAVVTTVTAYNSNLIKKSIGRELNRQGQVFFLHNRVKTIEKKAWEIRRLFGDGDIKIDIAHGQMSKKQLEQAMINFVLGKTDVLVCTTIIESGLDIPNANTIIINDADRFGLAELHQLRGRVGRYKHRAYAYMLLPKSRSITPVAARRLKAIEEYSHLGAGFRIALRDLEIRGAGNILGSQQSGHIQTVGYQMYCELLTQAVKRLRNEPVEKVPLVNIDLGFSAYIPKNYIPLDRSRMEIYRRLAVAENNDDLRQIQSELADVFGPVADEVKLLLKLARIRIAAARLNIKSIVASGQNLIFSFSKDTDIKFDSLFKNISGRVNIAEPTTVYLRLAKNYFEPETLMGILRKILKAK